ncbi:unnamed protein product [Rodentolepis nana]|uniref:PH domain-containing protein n=1 Tax=Rodentolepis nana TaxID=102285 RepID=A0A3P7SDZ9_RODNA|nr:unnamed protein product [Rodentolepis nana]
MSLHNAGLESSINTSVSFSEGICQEEMTSVQNSTVNRQRHSDKIEKTQSTGTLSSAIKAAHTRTHRVVFAAPSEEQKHLWVNALNKVIGQEKSGEDKSQLHSISSSQLIPRNLSKRDQLDSKDGSDAKSSIMEAPSDVISNTDGNYLGLLGPRSHVQQTVLRCSGLAYVCWHRRLSVSLDNILNANQYEISGYLLRKFKSSCGWQKLWSVFTDFTLFFYKSPEEFTPIASLPLLGYRLESARPSSTTVAMSGDADDQTLHKSEVLQLTYKSHVYYFRTDTPVSFERWHTALSSALNPLSYENK